MPGYGFSGKPTGTGWDAVRTANAYVELMKRLGYTRFVAQGGDWGAVVVDVMVGGRDDPAAAEPAPPELIGIHTNMAGAIPQDVHAAAAAGSPPPSGLSDEELSTYEQLRTFYAKHVAYGLMMATRPQTLYGLADSPIDLAAFTLDHGDGTGQPGLVKQALEGRLQSDLTRDDLRQDPGRRERLRRRALPGPAELGRAGVPQPRLLQPARQGRPLRGLGTAAAALRRRARDVPITALEMTLFERVHMPSFGGGAEWPGVEPLGPADLWGRGAREPLDADVHQLAAPGDGGGRQDEQAWRRRQDQTP